MTTQTHIHQLFAAVLAGGLFVAAGASANITVGGSIAGSSIAGIDSDDDSTVTTTGITYETGANAAFQGALAAQFPAWTFTYAPGLSGTLSVNTYVPTSTADDNGGGEIDVTYTRDSTDPTIANLRWIQLVTTNDPLGGGPTTGYIDPLPNDDTLPFYWTTPEDSGANDGDKSATTYHFYDNSQRTIVSGSTPITWNGILLLASWTDPGGYDWINESPATGRNVTVYDGISWGWTLTDPDADVPEPAAWTLMIIGVSALGGALRARRRALA